MKLKDAALSIASGILLILSFPRWNLEPLAWVAFVPAFVSFRGMGMKRAFLMGFVTGLAANTGILYWTTVAMAVYGHIPWVLSILLLLLLASILSALYFGPWAMAVEYLGGKGVPEVLSAPLAWASLEFIRNYLFTGFPWESLGYSQYLNLPLIQMAEYTGVYGVSFVLMLVNASLYSFISSPLPWWERVRVRGMWLAMSGCLLLGLYTFGNRRLSEIRRSQSSLPRLRVGLVQGNIEQDKKWDPAFQQETMNIYTSLSAKASQDPTGLIIWPETAAPFYFQSDLRYRPQLLHLPQELRTYLLFGSIAYGDVAGRVRYYNSAFLVSPEGLEVGRYDKLHMVPFGEYLPFPLHFLYPIFDKIIGSVGDFTPGKDASLFTLPDGKFGVLICYEIIFPELSRRLAREGAGLLVTITNDAWFGATSAPYQHISMAAFRAVENRRYVARAANTGISGVIDMAGTIVLSTDIFRPAAVTGDVGMGNDTTFYTAYGDVFAFFCLLVLTVLIFLSLRSLSPGGD